MLSNFLEKLKLGLLSKMRKVNDLFWLEKNRKTLYSRYGKVWIVIKDNVVINVYNEQPMAIPLGAVLTQLTEKDK